MGYNLKNRNFLSLRDFSPTEIGFLLKLSADLKAAKYAGSERQMLKGKEIALIFEKDSTRTRAGFEVAAHDQGAHVTYLGPTGSHLGRKETVKDTARVLGRMYDGIEYRGFGQAVLDGNLKAPNGQAFTDVLWIGIGGSGLGPLLMVRALQDAGQGLPGPLAAALPAAVVVAADPVQHCCCCCPAVQQT